MSAGINRNYDDIIDLPHHVSSRHPQMSAIDRAAQFAPFAALTGHGDAIRETARLTDRMIVLDEDEVDILDEKLRRLTEILDAQPQVTVVYFQPDAKKQGGSYLTATGIVRKIDGFSRKLVFQDGMEIEFEKMLDLDYRG